MSRDLLLKIIFGGDAQGATKAANDAKSAVDRLGDAVKKPLGKAGAEIALDAIKPKAEAAAQAVKLSSQQLGQMQFQLQDIAVGLTSGQSPFTVMMQQGSQMAQMFQSGTGVKGALQAVGQGITQFLSNPLNIAVLGFGAAATAAGTLFSYLMQAVPDANEHLKAHEDLGNRIADAYDKATGKVKEFARETKATLLFMAQEQAKTLKDDLEQSLKSLVTKQLVGAGKAVIGAGQFEIGGIGRSAVAGTGNAEFLSVFDNFVQALRTGKADVKAFEDQLSRIGVASDDQRVDDLVVRLQEATKGTGDLELAYRVNQERVKGLSGDTDALNKVLGTTTSSLQNFTRAVAGLGHADVIGTSALKPSPGFTGTGSAKGFAAVPEAMRWMFLDAGRQYGVDADLLARVAYQESRFNPRARSGAGAMGIMQLMPGTAADMGIGNPWDARSNITGGAKYLADLLRQFAGNQELALMGYNWGPGNVRNWQKGGADVNAVPDETRNYVASILGSGGMAQATKADTAEKQKQIAAHEKFLAALTQGSDGISFQIGLLGKSTFEAARMTREQQLLNQAKAGGIEMTPALLASIKAEADLYGKKAAALKLAADASKLEAEAQKKSIAALDETRSMFGGLASDFLRAREEGKSWGESLSSVLDKLKEKAFSFLDKLIDAALFGQQGSPNGGLLGGFLTSLLGSFGGGHLAGAAAPTGGLYMMANGGAFAGGIQAFASGGIFARPTLFRYGAGRLGVMGEAGPEAVMPLIQGAGGLSVGVRTRKGEGHLPLTRLSSGRLGVTAFADGGAFGSLPAGSGLRGEGLTVNHIVNNHSPAAVTSKSRRNATGGIDIETTVKQIFNQHLASGDADAVLQGRFSVQRKLTSYG